MFKTYSFASLGLVIFVVSAALGAAPTPQTACGSPGKAPCPLQAWMRERLARPYALRRFGELGANAGALVALNPNPKEWRDWDGFARDVQQAAAARDGEGALHACSQCHHSYRHEYVETFRERALPTASRSPQ